MIHRQTTKELIADSLKELFTHKTADKITVKEIAQNCGITPATFYGLHNAIFDVINYFAENRKFIINAIMHTSGQDSFICHVFRINFEIMCDFLKQSRRLDELPIKTEMLLKLYHSR